MQSRTKSYQRDSARATPYDRSNPDAPGGWKHDKFNGPEPSRNSSLASRLSSGSSRGSTSLSSRITSYQGKELPLPTKLSRDPQSQSSNPNSSLELFPSKDEREFEGGVRDPTYDQRQPGQGGQGRNLGRSVFASSVQQAGLAGQDEEKRREKEMIREREKETARRMTQEVQAQKNAVSIRGLGKIWVRVENLAQGTTAEDVQSAFAPSPVISAKLSPSPSNPNLVSIDLEYADRSAAEELVKTYNGVVADGNALKVAIVPNLQGRLGNNTVLSPTASTFKPSGSASLGARMGNGGSSSGGGKSGAGKELVGSSSGRKMYSDAILRDQPTAGIITLADDGSDRKPIINSAIQRQNAWAASSGGSSLSQRVGRAGGGGAMHGWN